MLLFLFRFGSFLLCFPLFHSISGPAPMSSSDIVKADKIIERVSSHLNDAMSTDPSDIKRGASIIQHMEEAQETATELEADNKNSKVIPNPDYAPDPPTL